MPLPILFGAGALAARFGGGALLRGAGRLLGGRLGIGITGGVAAGGALARRGLASRGGQLALTGGAGAGGAALLNRGGGGLMTPQPQILYGWNTGTAQFYRLADGTKHGKIAAQRKDGSYHIYSPYRPVVIPKRWNSSSMGRVKTALKRQRKTALAIARMSGGLPKS